MEYLGFTDFINALSGLKCIRRNKGKCSLKYSSEKKCPGASLAKL